MRRYFESLCPADVPAISSVPDGPSLSGGIGRNIVRTSKSLITRIRFVVPQAQASIFHNRPPVLHFWLCTPCLSVSA